MKDLTLGILAHVDAGKTTLSEALLYQCGTIRTLGRVDHRDAFMDTDRLERERGITIYSKGAVLTAGDLRIQLLDTPGHSDFSAETERVMSVLDCAVLVISAADGVQSHTRTIWNLLEKYNVPVFLFLNKMDRPGADRSALLENLRSELSSSCVSFDEPDTPEHTEEIAVADETLLDTYLTNGTLTDSEIRSAIRDRRLFPVCSGSALHLQGIEEFVNTFSRYAEPRDYPETFGARIYKISRDEKGVRLTHLKVTGGSLPVRKTLSGTGADGEEWSEKVHSIRIYNGASWSEIPEAKAGTVCAVTGLTHTVQGGVLGFEEPLPPPLITPVLHYRLLPPEHTDPAVLYRRLLELQEEEPELYVVWKENQQEIQVQIMGEVQTEVLTAVIEERLGIHVTFTDGSIMYKETVASDVEGVGHYEPLRHYAEVHLILSPGKPGSGITISSSVSSDVLATNWQRLIHTHLQEKTFAGVLTGSPLTDVHFTIAAGRASIKHTEGGDFRPATYRAVRHGLMRAENVLLEPFYQRYWEGSTPLWVLLSLFWVNVIFYALRRWVKPLWALLAIVIGCSALGYWLCVHKLVLPLMLDTSLVAMPYFVLGWGLKSWGALEPSRYDRWGILALVAVAFPVYWLSEFMNLHFQVMQPYWKLYLLPLLAIVALFWACKPLPRLPVLCHYGRYSLIILGTHPLFFLPIRSLCMLRLGMEPGITLTLVVFIATIILEWPTIWLLKTYAPRFTAQQPFFKPGWKL